MAITRLCGFEAGSSSEVVAATGTVSWASTGQRTGSYALRSNPTTTAVGYAVVSPLAATGTKAATTGSIFADGSAFGFAFKAATLPAASEEIIARSSAFVGEQWTLTITSAGVLKLYAGTTAGTLLGTGATVIGNAWVYIEVRVNNTTNAYDLRINGVSELTGTNAGITTPTQQLALGKAVNTNGQTVDFYYDDVYVDDAGTFLATASALPEVKILLPDAAGDGVSWTNGTGTQTFAEVDEVPPESDGTDLTYLQAAATEDTLYRTSHVEDTATKAVAGSISAVEGFVWARTGSVSGTSAVSIRVRSNTTNSDGTGLELLTTYQGLHRVLATDPATSAAWTVAGVDAVQIGMVAGTIAQTQRFSASYIFVLSLAPMPIPKATIIRQAVNRAASW